ncbi:hypothetical protein M427DRAFT_60480 [Gonapodya prolifera JEL478]|uniref:sphingomyelin phosphodiesterase n=1 Tax=Gonapodya prolifera (strain JEL478) TaxID=1344416 RepID=A0A139A469_GONPJ|nr:hypothetical protein M427DRAFT_60480 [Gonapodya prolifera JEL478]|eukprot:KXS11617.1 hypothetical protein M427DRAFT_60480 [Gonapodya prolifera JEL478]
MQGDEPQSRPLGNQGPVADSGVVCPPRTATGGRRPPLGMGIPSGPHEVRVLSLNIHLRVPGVRSNGSDFKNARLDYFCEKVLEMYDVICLQEMFAYGSSRQSKLISQAKKLGFEYYVASPTKGLVGNGAVDGGLMVMSRYPIVKAERITYKRGINNDKFLCKGAVYAKVQIGHHHYAHVFNTQVQSVDSYNTPHTDPASLHRLSQILTLKEFVDECSKSIPCRDPMILVGDFSLNARKSRTNGKDSDDYALLQRVLRGGDELADLDELLAPVGVESIKPGRVFHVRDVAVEALNQHPVLVGDVEDFTSWKPRETALTSQANVGVCACPDFMFVLEPEPERHSPDAKVVQVDPRTFAVEKFVVQGEEFSQLSDHYGMSAIIKVPN